MIFNGEEDDKGMTGCSGIIIAFIIFTLIVIMIVAFWLAPHINK